MTYPINFHPGTKIFLEEELFHVFYENSKNYGATAHIMDAKVDTGKIIEEKIFNINDYDDVRV